MPNLRKYSGTKLLEAVESGQRGFEFGDRMATSKSNRDIAREDSARREDENLRAEERHERDGKSHVLDLEAKRASTTGQKGLNAMRAQDLGESQRSEKTRLEQLEANLAQTESATVITQDRAQREQERHGAQLRSDNARASSDESKAAIDRRINQRAEKTKALDDQAAAVAAQNAVQSLLTENARGYAESINLPLKLETEELNARVDNQLAVEQMAIKMATSKTETQETIAGLNAQALEGANRTMASLARHRPADALRYAYESPNFGIKRAEGNKVVINEGKVEIQDKNGDVVHDSVRDQPAVFDFSDMFAAVDREIAEKDANVDYIKAQTERAMGGSGKGAVKSALTPAEERARFDDIVQEVTNLEIPEGIENLEQYKSDVFNVIARDTTKFSRPAAVVALDAKKHVETTTAKKAIDSALAEAGVTTQVSAVDILTFVTNPENGVSSPTEAVPLIIERYLKATR